VKNTLTREEVFYCHRGRHPVLMQIKTGVKKDGAITAMHFKSFLDGGAYGSYGVASTFYTGALQTVTYDTARYRFRGLRAFTNKPPCGPKRGHGTPQPRFALEVQLDKIAEELQLDPAEMRKTHLVPPNSLTANYLRVGSMGLGACIVTMMIPIPDCASFRRICRNSCWANRSSAVDGSSRSSARGWCTRARAIRMRRASPDDISSVSRSARCDTSMSAIARFALSIMSGVTS